MKVLRTVRNYICYCGIEKDEYNAIRKDAFISNFRVWRILHCAMTVIFGILYVNSLFNSMLKINQLFYLLALIYSAIATGVFFLVRKDSVAAQLIIYLSISLLFLFACLITQNKPAVPATMFIVLLLISPMFMIDKPYFMAIELSVSSAVFLFWMYRAKPYEIWQYDLINVIIYTVVGIFLHVIANSLRIKEFVLTRKLNIQKDTDGLTGLNNKDALTRAINEYLADDSGGKGLLFFLDLDRFKAINDTYGHDVGDSVIRQMGAFLGSRFSNDEIVGRFGGDEFILFLKGTDSPETAAQTAREILAGAAEAVSLPDGELTFGLSIGVAVYRGLEKNYSEIIRKADAALYRAKGDPDNRFRIYS